LVQIVNYVLEGLPVAHVAVDEVIPLDFFAGNYQFSANESS
jgi:hypothetical protein